MKKKVLTNQQLQSVFEQAAVGMVIVDAAHSRFVKVNPRFCEIVGYSVEELLQGSIHDITHPDDLHGDLDRVERISAGIAPESSWEKRYRKKDGTVVWARVFVTPLDPSEARPMLRLEVIEDISERRRAEEALQERDIQFKKLSSWVPGMIYQFTKRPDGTYCVPFTTEAIKDIFGCSPQDVREDFSPIAKTIFPEDFDKVVGAIEYSAKHLTIWTCEFRVQIPGRSIRWMFGNSTPEKLADGSITWYGFNTDITDRKRIEEALQGSEKRYRELSIVDDLTQLYNSRHFYQQLKMEINRVDRYGLPLTLLLLDLDDFKVFNDAYGHVEGDQVLSRLGQVVKRCLRQTDSAYRYGGEEFVVLLPMTTNEEGDVTAERIRTEFKNEIFSPAPGQDIHVTVSIGLAQYKPQEEMKEFVNRVDQLMYQGKKNGKDRVCCES